VGALLRTMHGRSRPWRVMPDNDRYDPLSEKSELPEYRGIFTDNRPKLIHHLIHLYRGDSNVTLDTNSINNLQSAEEITAEEETGPSAGAPASEHDTADGRAGDADAPATESAAESEAAAADSSPDPEAPTAEALLTAIAATRSTVEDQSRRYHTRAEQRESVIDLLRSELEMLRRGERRGLLRPLLADLCRLRGDLLSQSAALPADFDAVKAADLLRSYAETIELTLDSNGVVTYAPEGGERFDPRLHRRVGGEPTDDPALAGHIAAVRRVGYLDIEANSPIAPAEVIVFAAAKATGGDQ
jgi:molecular chaperone GrpE